MSHSYKIFTISQWQEIGIGTTKVHFMIIILWAPDIRRKAKTCPSFRKSHRSKLRESVLAWTGITTYHGLGGLNSRHWFLTVLEAGKSEMGLPADSMLGKGSLPGVQTATFLPCPQMAERGSSGLPFLLIRV